MKRLTASLRIVFAVTIAIAAATLLVDRRGGGGVLFVQHGAAQWSFDRCKFPPSISATSGSGSTGSMSRSILTGAPADVQIAAPCVLGDQMTIAFHLNDLLENAHSNGYSAVNILVSGLLHQSRTAGIANNPLAFVTGGLTAPPAHITMNITIVDCRFEVLSVSTSSPFAYTAILFSILSYPAASSISVVRANITFSDSNMEADFKGSLVAASAALNLKGASSLRIADAAFLVVAGGTSPAPSTISTAVLALLNTQQAFAVSGKSTVDITNSHLLARWKDGGTGAAGFSGTFGAAVYLASTLIIESESAVRIHSASITFRNQSRGGSGSVPGSILLRILSPGSTTVKEKGQLTFDNCTVSAEALATSGWISASVIFAPSPLVVRSQASVVVRSSSAGAVGRCRSQDSSGVTATIGLLYSSLIVDSGLLALQTCRATVEDAVAVAGRVAARGLWSSGIVSLYNNATLRVEASNMRVSRSMWDASPSAGGRDSTVAVLALPSLQMATMATLAIASTSAWLTASNATAASVFQSIDAIKVYTGLWLMNNAALRLTNNTIGATDVAAAGTSADGLLWGRLVAAAGNAWWLTNGSTAIVESCTVSITAVTANHGGGVRAAAIAVAGSVAAGSTALDVADGSSLRVVGARLAVVDVVCSAAAVTIVATGGNTSIRGQSSVNATLCEAAVRGGSVPAGRSAWATVLGSLRMGSATTVAVTESSQALLCGNVLAVPPSAGGTCRTLVAGNVTVDVSTGGRVMCGTRGDRTATPLQSLSSSPHPSASRSHPHSASTSFTMTHPASSATTTHAPTATRSTGITPSRSAAPSPTRPTSTRTETRSKHTASTSGSVARSATPTGPPPTPSHSLDPTATHPTPAPSMSASDSAQTHSPTEPTAAPTASPSAGATHSTTFAATATSTASPSFSPTHSPSATTTHSTFPSTSGSAEGNSVTATATASTTLGPHTASHTRTQSNASTASHSLPLPVPPPMLPPVLEAVPVGVRATATTISAVLVATAAADAQAQSVLQVSRCARDATRGSPPDGAYRVLSPAATSDSCEGVLQGQAIIVGVVACLTMLAVALLASWAQCRRVPSSAADASDAESRRSRLVSIRWALGAARCPTTIIAAAVFAQSGVVVCGVELASAGDDNTAIGFLALLAAAAVFVGPVALAWRFGVRSYHTFGHPLALCGHGVFAAVVLPRGELRGTEEDKYHSPSAAAAQETPPLLKMLRGVVGPWRRHQPLWPLLTQASVLALLPAVLASGSACVPLHGLSAVLFVVCAGLVLITRPRRVLLADVLHAAALLVNGGAVAATAARLAAVGELPGEQVAAADAALKVFGAVQVVLTVARLAHAVLVWVLQRLLHGRITALPTHHRWTYWPPRHTHRTVYYCASPLPFLDGSVLADDIELPQIPHADDDDFTDDDMPPPPCAPARGASASDTDLWEDARTEPNAAGTPTHDETRRTKTLPLSPVLSSDTQEGPPPLPSPSDLLPPPLRSSHSHRFVPLTLRGMTRLQAADDATAAEVDAYFDGVDVYTGRQRRPKPFPSPASEDPTCIEADGSSISELL